MNTPKNPAVVADDVVVSLDYTLTVDAEVVDSSEGSDPIEFLQGHGQIITGLEQALYGMKIGDEKMVVVKPSEGYGEVDEDAFIDVPRSEFPSDIPAQVGVAIQMQDEHGEVLDARIFEVSKDVITLDFNHPLAGKELTLRSQWWSFVKLQRKSSPMGMFTLMSSKKTNLTSLNLRMKAISKKRKTTSRMKKTTRTSNTSFRHRQPGHSPWLFVY